MLISVPQYIDVEDKIVGPLTAKQLGWMFGMGAVLLVCYNIFETGSFIIIAIVVMMIFSALAFYRPNGMTLLAFIGSSIYFFSRPKVYVWKREEGVRGAVISKKEKNEMTQKEVDHNKKKLNFSEIEGFAEVLDSEGMKENDQIAEILRQRNLKKK